MQLIKRGNGIGNSYPEWDWRGAGEIDTIRKREKYKDSLIYQCLHNVPVWDSSRGAPSPSLQELLINENR